MRIVMATFGTMGDVQPFLALGVELLRRGHQVALGGPANFAARVEGLGLTFIPLGAAADAHETRSLFTSACELRDVNAQVQATLPYALENAEASVRTLLPIAAGADALLSIPYQAAGRITAELLGLAHVSVHFSPFGMGRRPRISAIAEPGFNACRAVFGLDPVADPLGSGGISADLALTPVSRALFPQAAGSGQRHTTGFWFLDEPAQVAPELAAFVAAGAPPAVLGFGSMTHQDPAAIAKVLVEAVRLAGIRAVIQTGWSGLELPGAHEDILFAPFVPHSWLFPRAGCIVHAGGAGTSAAAFRAGVPSVFVPHWLDQYLWGALAVERKLASASIPLADLGPERLAEAMRRALEDPRHREAAAATAAAIAAEDGVGEAADRVEALVARGR